MGSEWNRAAARPLMYSVCAGALAIGMTAPATAYETATHRRLTMRAVDQSELADTTQGPLAALGITDRGQKLRAIAPSGVGEIVPATELVGLGAMYEDEPLSEGRFLRHFFDPQQGGKGLLGNFSSKQWVLESDGDIPAQQFSLRDAQGFYWNALTSSDALIREQQTSQLLQAIGRAVHHLQDMAQPAHVRDDIHPEGSDGDLYERYTNTQFIVNNRSLPAPLPCGEAAIDLHIFDTAEKLWSNAGRGAADFTAHNFVSFNTNFWSPSPGVYVADSKHPFPAYPDSPVFEAVSVQQLGLLGPATVQMSLLGLPIHDAISKGGCFNSRAATLSFASYANPLFWRYEIKSVNWEANYPILFPRAINYSTGLINYFFRGRLRLESCSVTGGSVQIVVRNVSAAEFALAEMPGSTEAEFSIYYTPSDGTRHRMPLQGDDLEGDVLNYGETATFSFPLPAQVDNTLEKPFVLVFNGKIGNEAGIAAIPVGPSRGSAFMVTPNYVPADGGAGARVITAAEGGWQVSSQTDVVAGNIDWRGHDPEDVLTWHGPPGRYFGSPGSSPNIYRGGKLLTVGPGTVIGAALTVPGPRRYLIAAVKEANGGVVLYRRPYQLTYKKNGLFDQLNNPFGWKQFYSLGSSASSPMFFNASGTEGQVFIGSAFRIKVTISGDTASQTQIGNNGSYRRVTLQSWTPSVNVETNPGPRYYCESKNFECVGPRGDCTNPDGSVSQDVCFVRRAQETVTHANSDTSTSTVENIKSSVVCADYHGDLEVLCQVEAEEDGGGRTVTQSGERTSTRRWTLNQTSCDAVPSGPQLFRNQYQSQESNHSVMVFRVGSRSVRLSGTSWRTEKNFSSGVSWEFGTTMPQRTVTYTYEHVERKFDSRLLYADARYDLIAYEDHVNTEPTFGTGSVPVLQNPITYQLYMNLNATLVRRRETKVLLLADREYVISSNIVEGAPQASTPQENPNFNEPTGPECTNGTAGSDQSQITTNYDSSGFYSTSVHPLIKQQNRLSISALSQSMLVASVPIWVRQPDNTYVQQGTWNQLSGGSLPALLSSGSSLPAPSYMPTGIVR